MPERGNTGEKEREEHALKRCGDWFVRSERGIACGIAGAAVTLAVCALVLLMIRKMAVPLVKRRHPAAGEELEAVAAPVSGKPGWNSRIRQPRFTSETARKRPESADRRS